MEQVCRLDTGIGQAFAEVARQAVVQLCGGAADLIVSHGQTVFHWVEDGSVRGTLQLGEAAWIAEATGLPVVSDLRTRDVAAGGLGGTVPSCTVARHASVLGSITPGAAGLPGATPDVRPPVRLRIE